MATVYKIHPAIGIARVALIVVTSDGFAAAEQRSS